MCKIAAFYEGGVTYKELCDLSIIEVMEIAGHAKTIYEQRKKAMNNGK